MPILQKSTRTISPCSAALLPLQGPLSSGRASGPWRLLSTFIEDWICRQNEGGVPERLMLSMCECVGGEPRPKFVAVVVVVSLSRCRRTPPRAMCRKIRRARPPLSYAVSIRTQRRRLTAFQSWLALAECSGHNRNGQIEAS